MRPSDIYNLGNIELNLLTEIRQAKKDAHPTIELIIVMGG